MGLDMHLMRKTYVGWLFGHNRDASPAPIPDLSPWGIDSNRVSQIEEEVIYWGKANQIHQWFVDHVQAGVDDCGHYYVGVDDLKRLYDTVCMVLEDHDRAQELLTTQGGFFFGNTEYGIDYWDDIEYTKEKLGEVLKEPLGRRSSYEYHSSW